MFELYFTMKSVSLIIGGVLMVVAVIWAAADHFKKNKQPYCDRTVRDQGGIFMHEKNENCCSISANSFLKYTLVA